MSETGTDQEGKEERKESSLIGVNESILAMHSMHVRRISLGAESRGRWMDGGEIYVFLYLFSRENVVQVLLHRPRSGLLLLLRCSSPSPPLPPVAFQSIQEIDKGDGGGC